MDRANTNPDSAAVASEEPSAKRALVIPGVLLASLVGVCFLWLRFGNGVFAASIINGFIACF